MYRFFLKYKEVIIDAFIMICLILVSIDYGRDFFLGAASGAVVVKLAESIGKISRWKNDRLEKEIFQ